MFKYLIIALALIAVVSATPGVPPASVAALLGGGYGSGGSGSAGGSSNQGSHTIGHGEHLNFDANKGGYGHGGPQKGHH